MEKTEGGDRFAALLNNIAAVRAVVAAVSGTLGPKGLDCLLVDASGRILVTNDGVTVLRYMSSSHPAARMVINVAQAQDETVGDGTTTATVLAGALLEEASKAVLKGVPVVKIIEGIRWGLQKAREILTGKAICLDGLGDPRIERVAFIAARGQKEVAELIISAARELGPDKFRDPGFRFSDCILAMEGLQNKVYNGAIISKKPMHRQMPKLTDGVKVLVVDDALEPERIEEEALATEAGFRHFLKMQEEFLEKLSVLADKGLGLVLADRTITAQAEQLFLDRGVVAIQRVDSFEITRAAELCRAVAVKKTVFKKPVDELFHYLGNIDKVRVDEHNQLVSLENDKSQIVTVCLGASTTEVVEERERVAKDAAAAVQAAFCGGVVPGGGSAELLVAKELTKYSPQLSGLTSYGLNCLIEALKYPLTQIAMNSGFNPLEKVDEIWNSSLTAPGLDCDSGKIIDFITEEIFDPMSVKEHALYSAGEVAEAILKINTVVKMRTEEELQS